MVTIQDVTVQLTKPMKELADWNYPFSQALETYCSLFNKTCNKSFCEAGLVIQNSTAVYVHRIDCLWNKTEHFRHMFTNSEEEEAIKNFTKKRDRKIDINFRDFKTVNFAEEVEKNIDIKRNHMIQETVKSKSHRFTQLEKGIAQYFPIDIYDVNGEVIGKKYDFRCNQNISMDGILVDEFAPQDFNYSDDNSSQVKSLLTRSDSTESFGHSNAFDSAISFESEQNPSLSTNTTLADISSDILSNSHMTLTDINETAASLSTDINSLTNNNIVNSNVSLNNSDLDAICSSNIEISINDNNYLSSTSIESICSEEQRTPSMSNTMLSSNMSGEQKRSKSLNRIQNTPSTESSRLRSKSTSKLKRNIKTSEKKKRVVKNLLKEFQKKNITRNMDELISLSIDQPNMFQEDLSTCIKYISQYDPLQYEEVMNIALDFVGFRLRAIEPNKSTDDNVISTSTDDEMSEHYKSSPTSPLYENFCDAWLRSDTPHLLSENIDKWHEFIQPKLREAEQRSTFCIRDYSSRIMDSLKASDQRKINFDEVIQRERACEVARYFLASLDLASQQNVDIKKDEHNIEITLREKDGQSISNH